MDFTTAQMAAHSFQYKFRNSVIFKGNSGIYFGIWPELNLENFLETTAVKSLTTLKTLCAYRHLVRLFWNQVLTWASVILRFFANVALSVDAKYFCLWNRFSSSQIWSRENEVRGFFLFGGVRFW